MSAAERDELMMLAVADARAAGHLDTPRHDVSWRSNPACPALKCALTVAEFLKSDVSIPAWLVRQQTLRSVQSGLCLSAALCALSTTLTSPQRGLRSHSRSSGKLCFCEIMGLTAGTIVRAATPGGHRRVRAAVCTVSVHRLLSLAARVLAPCTFSLQRWNLT